MTCEACDHGWVELDAGPDGDPAVRPCRECRSDEYERWRELAGRPADEPLPVPPALAEARWALRKDLA